MQPKIVIQRIIHIPAIKLSIPQKSAAFNQYKATDNHYLLQYFEPRAQHLQSSESFNSAAVEAYRSIDMTRVLEVAAAEDITGHPYSLAITSPEGVTFVKGTCREETRWWADVLQVYSRNKVSSIEVNLTCDLEISRKNCLDVIEVLICWRIMLSN